jgi:hypothetical protein
MTTNLTTKTDDQKRDQSYDHIGGDLKICQECLSLMKTSADKCRSMSERSTSAMCKGGLSTAAFVCEGIANSMEKCIEMMTKSHSENVDKIKSGSPESRPLM